MELVGKAGKEKGWEERVVGHLQTLSIKSIWSSRHIDFKCKSALILQFWSVIGPVMVMVIVSVTRSAIGSVLGSVTGLGMNDELVIIIRT